MSLSLVHRPSPPGHIIIIFLPAIRLTRPLRPPLLRLYHNEPPTFSNRLMFRQLE